MRELDEGWSLLLVGCAGSPVATGIHTLADLNLHIQANSMILAWITRIASAVARIKLAARTRIGIISAGCWK